VCKTPSPALVIAVAAFAVALGGTAVAATSAVTIADPTTPTHQAAVSAGGALQVGGTVAPTPPKGSFFGFQGGQTGVSSTLIGRNKATVALSRLDFENPFDQAAGGTVRFIIIQAITTTSVCDGSSGSFTIVGTYVVPVGQSTVDEPSGPIVLKPPAAGTSWCLLLNVAINGNPATYSTPFVSFSGYTVSGSLPAGSVQSVRHGATAAG
jgi:hypothetical protein